MKTLKNACETSVRDSDSSTTSEEFTIDDSLSSPDHNSNNFSNSISCFFCNFSFSPEGWNCASIRCIKCCCHLGYYFNHSYGAVNENYRNNGTSFAPCSGNCRQEFYDSENESGSCIFELESLVMKLFPRKEIEGILKEKLIQPARKKRFNFQVRLTNVTHFLKKLNLGRECKINISILETLNKIEIIQSMKKATTFGTEYEAHCMKIEFFRSLYEALSNVSVMDEFHNTFLLSNRTHIYNQQKVISDLTNFDLIMKLFLDMHKRIFNNAEELKDRIRRTCMLIAAISKNENCY